MNATDNEWLAIPRFAIFPSLVRADNYGMYGEAYRQAAELLWKASPKFSDEQTPRPDFLALPILFLIHHSVELYLKEVSRLCFAIGELKGVTLVSPRDGHNLEELAKEAAYFWDKLGLEDSPIRKLKAREILDDLHKFATKGEALRYPTRKGGKPSFPEHYIVNVQLTFEAVEELWRDLDGSIGYLYDLEQTIEDVLRDNPY